MFSYFFCRQSAPPRIILQKIILAKRCFRNNDKKYNNLVVEALLWYLCVFILTRVIRFIYLYFSPVKLVY